MENLAQAIIRQAKMEHEDSKLMQYMTKDTCALLTEAQRDMALKFIRKLSNATTGELRIVQKNTICFYISGSEEHVILSNKKKGLRNAASQANRIAANVKHLNDFNRFLERISDQELEYDSQAGGMLRISRGKYIALSDSAKRLIRAILKLNEYGFSIAAVVDAGNDWVRVRWENGEGTSTLRAENLYENGRYLELLNFLERNSLEYAKIKDIDIDDTVMPLIKKIEVSVSASSVHLSYRAVYKVEFVDGDSAVFDARSGLPGPDAIVECFVMRKRFDDRVLLAMREYLVCSLGIEGNQSKISQYTYAVEFSSVASSLERGELKDLLKCNDSNNRYGLCKVSIVSRDPEAIGLEYAGIKCKYFARTDTIECFECSHIDMIRDSLSAKDDVTQYNEALERSDMNEYVWSRVTKTEIYYKAITKNNQREIKLPRPYSDSGIAIIQNEKKQSSELRREAELNQIALFRDNDACSSYLGNAIARLVSTNSFMSENAAMAIVRNTAIRNPALYKWTEADRLFSIIPSDEVVNLIDELERAKIIERKRTYSYEYKTHYYKLVPGENIEVYRKYVGNQMRAAATLSEESDEKLYGEFQLTATLLRECNEPNYGLIAQVIRRPGVICANKDTVSEWLHRMAPDLVTIYIEARKRVSDTMERNALNALLKLLENDMDSPN